MDATTPATISMEFILTGPDASITDAVAQLTARQGTLAWFLVVRLPDGSFQVVPFEQVRAWKNAQPEPRGAYANPVSALGERLLPVQIFDEDHATTADALPAAAAHPYGVALMSCWGDVTGLVRAKNGPAATVSLPATVSFAPVKSEPPQQVEAAAEPRKDIFDRARAFYRRYKIGVIITVMVGIATFLIQYLLPVLTTNVSEVFPSLFPPEMTGEWNVVVTGFVPSGAQAYSKSEARHISEVFYNRFADEISGLGEETGISVQVLGPGKTATIRGKTDEAREQQAAGLARKMKADVIVYGVIERVGEDYQLKPAFYVNIRHFYETEEISGQHVLGRSITILSGGDRVANQVDLNRQLAHRSEVMALMAKGLSMHFTHHYDEALELFTKANQDVFWEFNNGREVVDLFVGNAAGRAGNLEQAEQAYRDALRLDPEYARAYAGLGSVFYQYAIRGSTADNFKPDEALLNSSLEYYGKAISARHRSVTSDIDVKVALGKGMVFLTRWTADLSNTTQRDLAAEEFRYVVAQYGDGANMRVQEQASEAHARLGFIARLSGQAQAGIGEYTLARKLATNPARRGLYGFNIGEMLTGLGRDVEAAEMYTTAVADYQAAIPLTSQPEQRASDWNLISLCYERLGQKEEAIRALQQALNLLPEGLPERAGYEQRMQQLNAPAGEGS